jgi:hypothetical protein
MASSWWTKKSKQLLSDPDVTCAICGAKRWGVWINGSKKKKKKAGALKLLKRFGCHHIKYDRLGTEDEDKDIILLCYRCHDTMHTIYNLSKISVLWDKIYKFIKENTVWEYYESNEYLVPEDF